MSAFNALVGRRVLEIAVEPGEARLGLRTDSGWVFFDTDADCCSETWFADILNPQALLSKGAIITAAIELNLPDDDHSRSRQEYDCVYGSRLTTADGDCDIVYRNSSNGYYGGSADLLKVAPQDISAWKRITGDWAA